MATANHNHIIGFVVEHLFLPGLLGLQGAG